MILYITGRICLLLYTVNFTIERKKYGKGGGRENDHYEISAPGGVMRVKRI
jgi:hypothetical protein